MNFPARKANVVLLLLVVGLLFNLLIINVQQRTSYTEIYMVKVPEKVPENISETEAVTTQTTTVDDTTTNSFERNYSNDSAFVVKGYSRMKLMEKQATLRPLFNYSLTPWKVKIHPNETKDGGFIRWTTFIMIKSVVAHFKGRQLIRKQWGSIKYLNRARFEIIFIIGRGKTVGESNIIEVENEEYGDLLQIDMEELYNNVGYKTLAGMQWISQNLPPHWLYTSADDDMRPELTRFVDRMEEMITEELEKRNTGCSVTDSCIQSAYDDEILSNLPIQCGYRYVPNIKPLRHNGSKYRVNTTVYSLEFYPPCCFGGWYTMPVKTASALYQVSRQHTYFYLDDVWITGLLRLCCYSNSDVECVNCDVTDDSVNLWTRHYKYAVHPPPK